MNNCMSTNQIDYMKWKHSEKHTITKINPKEIENLKDSQQIKILN